MLSTRPIPVPGGPDAEGPASASAAAVALLPVAELRPIEGHSAKRARWLRHKIVDEAVWRRPLVVERTHRLVLDGHHRLAVAGSLGLESVPCVLFGYHEVEVWSLRANHEVSAARVVERALRGVLYPYKTAKHRFPVPIPDCDFALEALGGRLPCA